MDAIVEILRTTADFQRNECRILRAASGVLVLMAALMFLFGGAYGGLVLLANLPVNFYFLSRVKSRYNQTLELLNRAERSRFEPQ